MKRFLLIAALLLYSFATYAQETITLVVNGEGRTKEEAITNALRSAIEQSFGVFVSANTQILNDEIVKDEIATIASGNIKEYHELSCVVMQNGMRTVSISATVSISNLISYAKSKGSSVEFAGQVFAMNIKMRELNKVNEEIALSNLLDNLLILSDNLFNYKLSNDDPYRRNSNIGEVWNCNVQLSLEATDNSAQFYKLLFDTLEALSLSDVERDSYKKTNEPFYELIIADLPSYHPDLTGYSIHKKARSFWMRNNCNEFSKKLYDIISNAIYIFSIDLEGINERYTTSIDYNKYKYADISFPDNDNKNIVKGKDLGWDSYYFYLIPELEAKYVIRTTCSGVLPGLWYRPIFECESDYSAKISTPCIIEGYEQYQHKGKVILTLTFDIPFLGIEKLYKLKKITIDRVFSESEIVPPTQITVDIPEDEPIPFLW